MAMASSHFAYVRLSLLPYAVLCQVACPVRSHPNGSNSPSNWVGLDWQDQQLPPWGIHSLGILVGLVLGILGILFSFLPLLFRSLTACPNSFASHSVGVDTRHYGDLLQGFLACLRIFPIWQKYRCYFDPLSFLDTPVWVCLDVPWFVVYLLAHSVLRVLGGKDIPCECGYPLPLGEGAEYPWMPLLNTPYTIRYGQYPLRPNPPRKPLEAFEIIFAPPLVPLSGVRSTRYGVGTPDFLHPGSILRDNGVPLPDSNTATIHLQRKGKDLHTCRVTWTYSWLYDEMSKQTRNFPFCYA